MAHNLHPQKIRRTLFFVKRLTCKKKSASDVQGKKKHGTYAFFFVMLPPPKKQQIVHATYSKKYVNYAFFVTRPPSKKNRAHNLHQKTKMNAANPSVFVWPLELGLRTPTLWRGLLS